MDKLLQAGVLFAIAIMYLMHYIAISNMVWFGKRSVSCYGYEPWHWRYFGRELAAKMQASGQVPRRYLYENFEAAP
jgi:hypothetical protein